MELSDVITDLWPILDIFCTVRIIQGAQCLLQTVDWRWYGGNNAGLGFPS